MKAIGMIFLLLGSISYYRKGTCQWPKNGGICGRPTNDGKVYCNSHLHGS